MLEQKNIRIFFLVAFIVSVIYVLFIESERYQSSSSVLLKDLSSSQSSSGFDLSLLGASTSSQMQDSMVLETYLKSPELLDKLDKKFDLRKYYESDELDFINRLHNNSTKEEFLEKYLENIVVLYDQLSGILQISFYHTNPESSQKILNFILKEAENQINKYNQINTQKYLNFVNQSLEESKKTLDKSIDNLEDYQNKNLILNPTANAEAATGIISGLEAELVKKRAVLEQLKQYMSDKSFDVINLKSEIEAIQKSIKNEKSKLTGKGNSKLNLVIFEFERLKNQVEFEKEKYKQTLIQYEVAKSDMEKDAKTLQIVVQPNLPDGHTIPDRPISIINIIIVLSLFFGIVSIIIAIVKDHRD